MREALGVTKADATSDRHHSGRSSVAAAAAALFVMVDALAWSRMRHELQQNWVCPSTAALHPIDPGFVIVSGLRPVPPVPNLHCKPSVFVSSTSHNGEGEASR